MHLFKTPFFKAFFFELNFEVNLINVQVCEGNNILTLRNN
jgi:hypothetical protein